MYNRESSHVFHVYSYIVCCYTVLLAQLAELII